MFFDGLSLFHANTDSILHHVDKVIKASKSLGVAPKPLSRHRVFWQWHKANCSQDCNGGRLHHPLLDYSPKGSPDSHIPDRENPNSPNRMFDLHAGATTLFFFPEHHSPGPLHQEMRTHNIRQVDFIYHSSRVLYRVPSPSTTFVHTPNSQVLADKVQTLIQKEASKKVPIHAQDTSFYSRYCAVPKKHGDIHPIMDLRALNKWDIYKKFRMMSIQSMLLLLNQDVWIITIDLQDAYSHINIMERHHRFLSFIIGHDHYQFKVLPFDIASAPRIFTKTIIVIPSCRRNFHIFHT